MSCELVVVVDKFGKPIGTEEKLEAHRLGLKHLAFSVLIYRYNAGQLEFLLQKRAINKYHSGGLWSNTCCSHPRPDEEIISASQRRLVEELGITTPLELIDIGTVSYCAKFSNGLTENELDHVVIAESNKVEFNLNADEAELCEWWQQSDIEQTMKAEPATFSAWFRLVLEKTTHHLSN
ncbi:MULTISPECIES: isopentenyl-diphosphate Delta-isomerase [Vibrio]|uniref:Isopentenyl-diphosphate Delta-isomerase n=1 Tax=Vibrio mediterranei TaxID=689 RepID=A0AAN1FKI1_9VIBR|nr:MULTISPECIES: isopentenyl-diphosphate Delta-isomerase [Vibrio]ASI92282.1 isopentenyl-diphosphate delta-isomerase [Vibrio mediterranei]MCF4172823.1 isopentenyl-diphosphate Delta-isomerase [Vibrio sp. McD22-P3]MDA0106548.1 isopentenyl-diphosphate Delta-isomerase [Vibrio sp. La 4.2.2]NOI22923.1 isopentenyl-diphosphate Delta-isomerase [Vibrio mediterranei]NUW74774.1 isopentenyl-diphosphate Delta-isomerase [Vibrio mediterranei]